MIVDLHAHYPTQLTSAGILAHMTNPRRSSLRDKIRALILKTANRAYGYQTDGGPGVTIANLRAGNVRVALSMLMSAYSEVDLDKPYGAPPSAEYFTDLKDLLLLVEKDVATRFPSDAAVVHNHQELRAALAQGKVALIHAIEGGLYVGDQPAEVPGYVEQLKTLGVAYITIAHLFWRGVATNSPALPFLPDSVYRVLFPQSKEGLSDLGVALVEAMVDQGILIDLTHMSEDAARETFEVLDRKDPQKLVPVMATHSACHFGKLAYNIPDWQIRKIAERKGVVGLIACSHYMADGTAIPKPKTFQDTILVICQHIDHIRDVTGGHDTVAFGSDMDGFIRPALPGLELPNGFAEVERLLTLRYRAEAQKICSENALRVLGYWKGRP